MILFPNAKINLGLNIIAKRSDGFHEIESVLFPIEMKEPLEIVSAEKDQITITGIDLNLDPTQNMCWKAVELLRNGYDFPAVHLHLHKSIPHGAGLGGGSADAAFTLRLINELFGLNISNNDLENYASELGSDCPFFIRNQAMLVTGRGEILQPISIDLSEYRIEVIKPDFSISTKVAYSLVKPAIPARTVREIIQQPMESWKLELVNDFEEPLFEKYPELAKIKQSFYDKGAIYASLSGSGSALYGIYSL